MRLDWIGLQVSADGCLIMLRLKLNIQCPEATVLLAPPAIQFYFASGEPKSVSC